MPEAGLLTEVRWEWDGTEVTADAALGASTFTVLDPEAIAVGDSIWFGETGPHKVTALDEETGLVTVSPALTEALEESDPVVPDVGGQPARVWIAEVVLADSETPVEVMLSTSEVLILPEGMYDPPAAIILSDDLDRVVDLPGQYPMVDATVIDPDTVTPVVMGDWGVTPQSEFEANVAAVEADFTDVYTTIQNGDSANAQAIDDAVDDFNAGLATKSKHTLSANAPTTSSAGNAGDVWEQHKAGNTTKIIGRWRLMNSASPYSWSPMNLDATYIPLLDIGSGTFGDLSGERLVANTVGVSKLIVSDMTNHAQTGSFESAALRAEFPAPPYWSYGTVTRPDGTFGVVVENPAAGDTKMRVGKDFPVKEGESYLLSGEGIRTTTASAYACLELRIADKDGNWLTDLRTTDTSVAAGSGAAPARGESDQPERQQQQRPRRIHRRRIQ